MEKKNTWKQEEPEEELLEGHWPIEHPDDEWLRLEPFAAEKIAGFVPRRYELNQLVKFWYKVILDVYWEEFHYGCGGSIEASAAHFARGRIRRLRACLGNRWFDEVLKEGEKEFSDDKNSKECERFFRRHGTQMTDLTRI